MVQLDFWVPLTSGASDLCSLGKVLSLEGSEEKVG